MGLNQTWAKILGVVLVLVGLAGFFSGGNLLGFHVNTAHNLVHLLSGIIALMAGFMGGGNYAKIYNVIFGVVYLLVALLGLFSVTFVVDLLTLNSADNWLHIVLAVVTFAIGIWAS